MKSIHMRAVLRSLRISLQSGLQALRRFSYRRYLSSLHHIFAQERLGVTASSLTFTTLIALVPLFTLVLAVFTAFPAFSKMENSLEQWLSQSLFPESISRQVIGYLNLFASKAKHLGSLGFAFFLLTAISLVLTVDRTLNAIWHTRRVRPLAQRVLVYWTVISLGPVLIAASLVLSNYAAHSTEDLTGLGHAGIRTMADVLSFVLMAASMSAVFKFVPNTEKHAPVQWTHAWVGGLWAATGIYLAKKGLGLYLSKVPSLSLVYGAFATVPILVLWIYILWLVVLSGAVLSAYLYQHRQMPTGTGPQRAGQAFALALWVLQGLEESRRQGRVGLSAEALHKKHHTQASAVALHSALSVLQELDWVGLLDDGRYALLRPWDALSLEPLQERLLWAGAANAYPMLLDKPMKQWAAGDLL